MEVSEAIKTKRAVREFNDKPVPQEDIEAILDAGRKAQSSKNTQPWQFVVVRNPQTLKALSECGQYAGHLAGANFAIALIAPGNAAFDLGQAASYMQLAGWNLGIGSCLAAMWEPDKAKAILNVPKDLDFIYAISFGYPAKPAAEKPRTNGRKPLGEIVHWDKW